MPVTVQYDDSKRLVIWMFEGSWTWEEYYEKRGEVNHLIEVAGHRVDMIIDMTQSQLLPKNLMTHGGSAVRNAPDNIGKTIFVGSNTILRAFFRMFTQLYGALQSGKQMEYYMVASLDEAYVLLGEANHDT